MHTVEICKGFHFRVLTLAQQHRAIQYRAEEIYQERIERAALRDWTDAFRELSIRPKDEEVRPVAQAKYENRMAQQTEEARESAKLGDWLMAESDLSAMRDGGA